MSNGLNSRGRSTSPPTSMPLSKRDKRRSALQERLHDLTASFSQNRDTQFRQQLHALQCDMTLINNADPYNPGPIPDSAEEIAGLIEGTVGGGKFAKEMTSLAGMWYARFVQEVNQVKADRDADLAMLMVCLLAFELVMWLVVVVIADALSTAIMIIWTGSSGNMRFGLTLRMKNMIISPRRSGSV